MEKFFILTRKYGWFQILILDAIKNYQEKNKIPDGSFIDWDFHVIISEYNIPQFMVDEIIDHKKLLRDLMEWGLLIRKKGSSLKNLKIRINYDKINM